MPRLKATPAEIEKHLALLEETPRRLVAYAVSLDDERLHWSPGLKVWSASQILAHLRACADVWTHSIYAMLAEDTPTLPLLDERRWAKVTRYDSLAFAVSLQAFTLGRDELVRVLRQLPEAGWTRSADIGGRTHTVFSQTRRMALHEQEHGTQVAAYAVGPWNPQSDKVF